MPTIRDYGHFKIYMYYEDHNPPHVHLIGPDFAAKMRIADQVVFAGDAPAKVEKIAGQFVTSNSDSLLELWDQYSG